MDKIKHLILLSGKRKCGKDYLAERLNKRLANSSQVIRISKPIKSEWATRCDISLDDLLSDGECKERYRREMIEWSDSIRSQDYSYFCKNAMEEAESEIVIVSDIRRKNDIRYFEDVYGDRVKKIRLTCPDTVRAKRGYVFTTGVDDAQSECDLDDYDDWDLVIENNGTLDGEMLIDLIFAKFQF